MERLQELWKSYSLISKLLKDELGRTNNLVAEYAEHLIKDYTNGEILKASNKSSDVRSENGDLFQVKSRVIKGKITGSLGTIRSWDFDYLATVVFDEYGSVIYAGMIPEKAAKEYANYTEHQNGNVVSLSQKFMKDSRNINITNALKKINLEDINEEVFDVKEQVSKIPIGKYVRVKLKEVIDKGLIDKKELEKLQDSSYSKTTFDIQYPLLLKVEKEEGRRPGRYWKDLVTIGKDKFYVCSEWYERKDNNDRPYFEKWFKGLKN